MHVKCQVYTCYPESPSLEEYALGAVNDPAYEVCLPEKVFAEYRKKRAYLFKDPMEYLEDCAMAAPEAPPKPSEPEVAPEAPKAEKPSKKASKASKKASVDIKAGVDLEL